MTQPVLVGIAMLIAVLGCGGAQPESSPATPNTEAAAGGDEPEAADSPAVADSEQQPGSDNEFKLRESDAADRGRGVAPSTIKPTRTEAAIRFIVVDKDSGPVSGVVISLTAEDAAKYYTQETDAEGFAEVLVPIGKDYELVYLSLGPRDVAAKVTVTDEPKQNIKLTLRYKGYLPKPGDGQRFVLKGIYFDTDKATIRKESFPRLDSIVEYMTHKPSARIEISGHTDNVGKAKHNKTLSEKRAKACRDYLISKGIAAGRVEAVGYGDARPIASNDTDSGRQENRRIEATEL
jgi:outer membrane protein OmpA-like peptidoglycan-associated protein